MPVADVHPGRPDTHQHVVEADRRRSNLVEPQLVGVTVDVLHDGPHHRGRGAGSNRCGRRGIGLRMFHDRFSRE